LELCSNSDLAQAVGFAILNGTWLRRVREFWSRGSASCKVCIQVGLRRRLPYSRVLRLACRGARRPIFRILKYHMINVRLGVGGGNTGAETIIQSCVGAHWEREYASEIGYD
jgi:hypothetical protein